MRRPLIGAVGLTAVLALGACGSSGDGKSSSTATSSSSSAAAAGSGRVKVGDTVALSDLSKKGAAALTAAKTVKLKMSSSGETMNGEMAFGAKSSYKMSGSAQGDAITLIYVDKVLYLGGDSFKEMNGGKPYIKIDPNGKDAFSSMMAPVLKTIEQASNPSALFAGMEGVTAKVVKVDGDLVTYESTFTGDQMLKAAEKLLGTDVPTSTSTTGSMTVQQTFDKQDRPVSVVIKGAGDGDTTVTYSDWGGAVSIAAPPASQVGTFDMGDLNLPTPTSS